MSKSKILISPTSLLRTKCQKVKDFGPNFQKFVNEMINEVKSSALGVGLSAPQLGKTIKALVCYYGGQDEQVKNIPLTILVNPTITHVFKEQETLVEGCLSFPDVFLPVARPVKVHILAQDRFGKKIKLRVDCLLGRVIQHEIDHLNGIIYFDKAEIAGGKKLSDLRVLFFATPSFSLPTLESLKFHFHLIGVVSEPDKPAGRGNVLKTSAVALAAKQDNIPLFQPENLADSHFVKQLYELKPDMIVVCAYGKILPKEILDIPKYTSLNVHPSLLPKFRGPTPIQNAILAGEKTTGVTVIAMDEQIDHGPIVITDKIKIAPAANAEKLAQKLSQLASWTTIKAIVNIVYKKVRPQVQDDSQATFTHLLKKEDGFIENLKLKTQNANEIQEIERKIRAFYPWPKVWTEIGGDLAKRGKRIIIHRAHLQNSPPKAGQPRAEIHNPPAGGQISYLILDIVQPEGKKPMKYSDYLKGNPKII
ncbi:MAG: hypothetical protein COX39_01470 [Candidatus Nealsonbacteria bacterium CG23_combo_of_CG06-09_8_20_14_all_40_13]|uniref:Multifunctional fusion protein n=1 Tax=Candidatus Nealsonbacteria bacterium CG23_combo_of_CG06-09_8_20_14_all_40_13 TaxID=1974724 RepID=A0A2G9YSK9_9BACT|nr:MAG: hypothetical protein COX39_01470 [Candidatus Nealsonbacteria bacterium CG23_combo_of_CG06-09_8_20_14_all_40_13]